MTKKNALATARNLNVKCDAYLFATKVGAGCVTASKNYGDGWILLTLFINLIEKVMENLNTSYHANFRKLLCTALLEYLADTTPKPPKENLSDKQRRQRAKHTEDVITQLEAIL